MKYIIQIYARDTARMAARHEYDTRHDAAIALQELRRDYPESLGWDIACGMEVTKRYWHVQCEGLQQTPEQVFDYLFNFHNQENQ
jgi:hypothetical protein